MGPGRLARAWNKEKARQLAAWWREEAARARVVEANGGPLGGGGGGLHIGETRRNKIRSVILTVATNSAEIAGRRGQWRSQDLAEPRAQN